MAQATLDNDLFVFVDVNRNGDFDAARDLVFQLIGKNAAQLDVRDVVFS